MEVTSALPTLLGSGPTIWKVTGGVDNGGIKVRSGQEMSSAEEPNRLSTGALIQELNLVGERMNYMLQSGTGPSTGWVSIRVKEKQLLQKVEAAPVIFPPPQCPQTPGEPFVFYHQVMFNDTKPDGIRMSACFCVMDETRCDVCNICDPSCECMLDVTDPIIEITLELCPALKTLGEDAGAGGLMLTHPKSRGVVMSWLRNETRWNFPKFPFKVEEANLYCVGKDKASTQRTPVARGRFRKAFVDGATGGICDEGKFAKDMDKFHAKLKECHLSDHLAEPHFKALYPASGEPFTPTVYKKVVWKMTYSYGDCWSRLWHAKVPELLWEVNTEAGGSFAQLVHKDADPQAVSVNLASKMDLGVSYNVLCYLDEAIRKAVYVFVPVDSTGADVKDIALLACALYEWSNVPEDGKTLTEEDVSVIGIAGRRPLFSFGFGNEVKDAPMVDLSKLKPMVNDDVACSRLLMK